MYWKQCRHFWLDIRDNVRKISNTKKTFSLFFQLQQSQLPCWWLKKSVTEFLSLMWFKWFFFLTSQYKYNAEQHAIWSDLRGKSSKVCYTRIFFILNAVFTRINGCFMEKRKTYPPRSNVILWIISTCVYECNKNYL